MSKDNMPLDEYLNRPFQEKFNSAYEEDGALYDDMTAPQSELEREIDKISIQCSRNNIHPIALAALKNKYFNKR